MTVPSSLLLYRGQIRPRAWKLLRSQVVFWSLGVASVTALALPVLPAAAMRISEAADLGFTFAAIAMGACIAAVVLSIGLPGPDRLRRWANLKGGTEGLSALSDLVFVLVWATLAQIALLLTCIAALAFGHELPLAPRGMIPTHAAGLWLGLVVFFYALFELVVVIQTLSQMAAVVIAEERQPTSKREESSSGA